MIIKTWIYRGVTVTDAEHHVQAVSVSGTDMTFAVSIRAPGETEELERVFHGGGYSSGGGDVVIQAETVLLAQPAYDGAVQG